MKTAQASIDRKMDIKDVIVTQLNTIQLHSTIKRGDI